MNFRTNNLFIYAVAVVLLLVLFVTPFFLRKNISFGEYISAIWKVPSLLEENQQMRKEIEDLKNFYESNEIKKISEDKYVIAKVYSMYPFNTKSRIFLGSGSQDGIKKDSQVLFSKSVLLGYVFSVSRNSSEVITIYDTFFSLPVRVGKNEIDALLQGGISPRLTLIDKSKTVVSGDKIVSASKDMPYGLEIGYVGEVKEDASGAFFETSIQVPYSLNALRTVYILSK